MKRRPKTHPLTDYFSLAPVQQRGENSQACLGPGSLGDQTIEGVEVALPAIGIAGAVLLHGSVINPSRPEDLSPGNRTGQKVGVAEGDIGGGNLRASPAAFGQRERAIGQARSADSSQGIHPGHQTLLNTEVVRQGLESSPLLGLGPLPVVQVQKRRLVILTGQSRHHGGIHSATHENDGHFPPGAHQTPRMSGGQITLCSWSCSRTFNRSSRIQPASCRPSSTPKTGEKSTPARASRRLSRSTALAHS